MIIATHAIWSAYGFWLPNDERGSGSTHVWSRQLQPFGPATKVHTRHSRAKQPFDRDRRQAMRDALKYPPVRLTGRQARAAAQGIQAVAEQLQLSILACAIMPDHVHLVVRRHALPIKDILQRLQSAATRRMTKEGIHPFEHHRNKAGRAPSPWAEGEWCVYLNTPDQVRSRITYVQNNPLDAGLPPQHWRFVQPYTD